MKPYVEAYPSPANKYFACPLPAQAYGRTGKVSVPVVYRGWNVAILISASKYLLEREVTQ